MRPFKFKLESLYRLKIFKMEKTSIQLGGIINKINMMKNKIKKLNTYLQEEFNNYERMMDTRINARNIQLHPRLIDARRMQIKKAEKNLADLQKQYKLKKQELEKAKGEVKIMEKLKEDAYLKYKKKHNKKEEEDLEEINLMRFNGVNKYEDY
ncbi:MAG: flagellar export protein FliJ [Halobacteriovoraceae bacterium]|nr:flagellar export protein FliJ [Halobacteriovoraceae bacterium]